jgi:hypothetical protein
LHFKSKIKKKRLSGSKIIYDYTHMIYSLDLQSSYSLEYRAERREESKESVNTLWKFHQGSSVSTVPF